MDCLKDKLVPPTSLFLSLSPPTTPFPLPLTLSFIPRPPTWSLSLHPFTQTLYSLSPPTIPLSLYPLTQPYYYLSHSPWPSPPALYPSLLLPHLLPPPLFSHLLLLMLAIFHIFHGKKHPTLHHYQTFTKGGSAGAALSSSSSRSSPKISPSKSSCEKESLGLDPFTAGRARGTGSGFGSSAGVTLDIIWTGTGWGSTSVIWLPGGHTGMLTGNKVPAPGGNEHSSEKQRKRSFSHWPRGGVKGNIIWQQINKNQI